MRKQYTILLTLILLFFCSLMFGQPQYRINEAKMKAQSLRKSFDKNIVMTSNQAEYDVEHYLIEIEFNPGKTEIYGMVKVAAEVIGQSLSNIDLDLSNNMIVDSVLSSGIISTYNKQGDVLTINLEKEYSTGEKIEVTVYYNGQPEPSGLGSFGFDSYNGKPLIWSLSEPYGAREWWPSKDTPSDKADSVDIKFTVPEGMIVASNGKLMDEITANGKTTFWWKEIYPITTYLVSIAAYEYTHYTDQYISSAGDTMSLDFFVAPDHYQNSLENFSLVKDMIAIYSDLFGEYPFIKDKYGHAEFPWGGGMEHQTITSLGNIHYSGGYYSQGLIAHELAHMWWGDMITCSNFKNIWINEGFATYSEALLVEAVNGFEAYKNQMSIEEYYGPGTIYVDDTTNVNRIFSGDLSYSKGAYVLHMLRKVVGDENFFAILKAYGNDPRYKYKDAGIEDFQGVCEEVSGMDLEKFFDQWLYGEYFPHYSYGYSVDTISDGYEVNLVVDQIQTNTGLFWMPIDIRITTSSGQQTFTIWDSLETQTFTIALDEEPFSLEFDPDNWILKKTREKLVSASLDKGTLLVNGLNWILGDKVYEPYQNNTFWGNAEIAFWDLFDEPVSGYPPSLPSPIGNGSLSVSLLAQYSTVVWIAHNYGGDLNKWQNLAIMDYVKAGGNVILVTRMGREFIDSKLASYIGINWYGESSSVVNNCLTTYPGLIDMELNSRHTIIDLFETELTKSYSTLLFKSSELLDNEVGMGVWANPPDGGQFVYIAARPYLIDQEDLKTNIEYIATELMGETVDVEENLNSNVPSEFILEQNYPNPFNPTTKIRYSIPLLERDERGGLVNLKVYDVLGRYITTLVNEVKAPGNYEVDFYASGLATGVYFYELTTPDYNESKKMLLMR